MPEDREYRVVRSDTDEPPEDIIRIYRKKLHEQYEQGSVVPVYAQETALFACIKNGDERALDALLLRMADSQQRIGQMSDSTLRQTRYMLVSGVTLATRYAVAGGLPEIEAYSLSDVYIQRADRTEDADEVVRLFFIAIRDFACRVRSAKTRAPYSYPVARCVGYIGDHLYSRITLGGSDGLAAMCGVTPQYLSTIFRRETGQTLTGYIRSEKLRVAAQLLEQSDYSIQSIAVMLDFGSQSAFSGYFKEMFGATPREFRRKSRQI